MSQTDASAGIDRATGTFEVVMTPQPPYETGDGISLSRITIQKTFQGALQGTSRVEMLAAGTSMPGSAGYVAIERVQGTLDGRTGSFVLQHSGTMNRGAPQLTVSVVPDSGTAQLEGISGIFTIDIRDGKHFFTFDYRLGGAS
jgi:Protein of unknown function (DUF3224)